MFLIYISGIDGCGKTTQAQLLVKFLKEEGIDVQYAWLRWEPSLKRFFSFLRSLLGKSKQETNLSKEDFENSGHTEWVSFKTNIISCKIIGWLWCNYACADYYFASRKPFRKLKSDVVVVDRYVLDFCIDQASNLRIKPDDCKNLGTNFFLKRFRLPDLNIVIDLPALEGYTRKLDSTSLNYLKDREKYYRAVLSSEHTLHVNGLNDIDVVASEIAAWVTKKLWKVLA